MDLLSLHRHLCSTNTLPVHTTRTAGTTSTRAKRTVYRAPKRVAHLPARRLPTARVVPAMKLHASAPPAYIAAPNGTARPPCLIIRPAASAASAGDPAAVPALSPGSLLTCPPAMPSQASGALSLWCCAARKSLTAAATLSTQVSFPAAFNTSLYIHNAAAVSPFAHVSSSSAQPCK